MYCSYIIVLLLITYCVITNGHIHAHKYRSRTRNRAPSHSAQPLIAEKPPVVGEAVATAPSSISIECDFLNFKQTGCEDEVGSSCNAATGKCVCKPTHPVRLLDFCLPVSRLNGPCYTSGQCSTVTNASCYIFGKEYDLETASGGHNLGRMVKNWPLGVCKCRLGFAYNESSASCEKRLVGSWCSNDKHCLLRSLNSICDKKRGECECSWGTAYDSKVDACVPSPMKPSGKSPTTGPGGAGTPGAKSLPFEPLMPRTLYLAKCEVDNDCEWPHLQRSIHRVSTHNNITHRKNNSKGEAIEGTSTVSTLPRHRNRGLVCVRGRCICSGALVWEAGACREEWTDSEEAGSSNKTHHKTIIDLDDDLDDASLSWQTISSMAFFCTLFAGLIFRYCYYKKSEEDELAEDLRTAEALFAHKAALGPQHPFNALTAAFLSKPAPNTTTPHCGASQMPGFGYHGAGACFHHEMDYPYNYGMCGGMMRPPNQSPPPLNEQDEDEYLQREAEEAAAAAATSSPAGGESTADTPEDAPEIRSHSSDSGKEAPSMDECNQLNCCRCDCVMMVGPNGTPLVNDCCSAGALPGACASSCTPHTITPRVLDSETVALLAEDDDKKRTKRKKSRDSEDGDSEITLDEQEDDDKSAILKGNDPSRTSSGSLGRTLCSTAAGLVISQLASAKSSTNSGNKSVRRTSSCSSSSASLLNSSSSNDGNSGPCESSSSASGKPETVHLLVFNDGQAHSTA